MDDLSPVEALDPIVIDAIGDAVKETAKAAGKDAFANGIMEFVAHVAPEVAGVLLGAIAKALLTILLKRQDAVAAKLAVLIRAPFVTGMRAACEALQGEAQDEFARAFRERRLEFAIAQLDTALTLAPEQPNADSNIRLIRLVQDVCYRDIRGAHQFAVACFRVVIPSLSQEAIRLRDSSERLLLDAKELRESAVLHARMAKEPQFLDAALLGPTFGEPELRQMAEDRERYRHSKTATELELKAAGVGGEASNAAARSELIKSVIDVLNAWSEKAA